MTIKSATELQSDMYEKTVKKIEKDICSKISNYLHELFIPKSTMFIEDILKELEESDYKTRKVFVPFGTEAYTDSHNENFDGYMISWD